MFTFPGRCIIMIKNCLIEIPGYVFEDSKKENRNEQRASFTF